MELECSAVSARRSFRFAGLSHRSVRMLFSNVQPWETRRRGALTAFTVLDSIQPKKWVRVARLRPQQSRQTFTPADEESGTFSNQITAFAGLLRVTFTGRFAMTGTL